MMAVTATLLAGPVADAKNTLVSHSLEMTKRKNQENLLSTIKKQPVQFLSASPQQPPMMAAFETKTNVSTSDVPTRSPDQRQRSDDSPPFSEPNALSSTPTQSANVDGTSPDPLSETTQSREGKRKFSLSQYKEHKRLKSNEPIQESPADIDMRLDTKPPSSTSARDAPPATRRIVKSKRVMTKSILSEPGAKAALKKKVIWADEKQRALVQTSFFEIDACEQNEMHAAAYHGTEHCSLARIEQRLERDLRQQQSFPGRDQRPELPPLPPLIRILLPNAIPRPMVKSDQRALQEEREQMVLKALSIRSFLPDTPSEPDDVASPENKNELKAIPLEDNTSQKPSTEIPATETSTPVPKATTPAVDAISPQVAQILSAARNNLAPAAVNHSPLNGSNPVRTQPEPTLPSLTTPNLLSSLLSASQTPQISSLNLLANLLMNPALQFNLPPPPPVPTYSSMNQLLLNALSSMPSSTNTQPSSLSIPNPSAPFAPSMNTGNQGPPPGNFNNTYRHQRPIPNHRGHPYRRGAKNNNRRNYYSNRNGFS